MPKRPITIDDLSRLVVLGDPQISPDGARILFSRKSAGEKNKWLTNLWTVDRQGALRQWTSGKEGDGMGRWSPDGAQVAFVSGRDKPGAQLYLIPSDGGEARKLTSLPEGSIREYKWSPDSQWIAMLFRETDPIWTEAAAKEREAEGLSTPPREIDNAWYRLDGDGYFLGARFALYLVDAKTGEHRELFRHGLMDDYSFDWSPNSKELAVAAYATPNHFEESSHELYRVDLDGQSWKIEGIAKGTKSAVSWSPDGEWIAWAGILSPHADWGWPNTKLFVIPAGGGEAIVVGEEQDHCLAVATLSDTKDAAFGASLFWNPDSKSLTAQIGWRGETQIARLDLATKRIELLTEGLHSIGVGNATTDGKTIACLISTATRPPEIAVFENGKLEILTEVNKAFFDEVEVIEPEAFDIETSDGSRLHLWRMMPVGYLAPKRYPAVLEIHGGPHAAYGWTFFHEFQVLAAAGYVVVYSNPRGSKGYGQEHAGAISGAWGDKDWIDIQAATHWMQHQPYIHPGQMGVMGGSYGGYMTNWAIGHTHDFAAAITDRCVTNLVSMSGSSDFLRKPDIYWKGSAWGPVHRQEDLWLQSPIAYFDTVVTPTLVIHSEGDLRCNVEQGEQTFAALQYRGVPSRFVRYPQSTFHGMSRSGPQDLRKHRLREIVAWLDKFLK